MPNIPQFINQERVPDIQPGAREDVSLAGLPGEAEAQGANRVSSQMDEFNEKYRQARQVSTASDLAAQTNQQLDDLKFKWSKVADRDQAGAGFAAEAAALKTNTAQNIKDPEIMSLWNRQFDELSMTKLSDTKNEAFKLEASTRDATMDEHLNGYSHSYAAAGSDVERAQIIDAAHAEINGGVAGRWIAPERGEEKWIAFRQRSDGALAREDINKNPTLALKKLEDPAQYPMLDEYRRAILTGIAERRADSADNDFKGSVRSRYEDNFASISETGEPAVPLSNAEIKQAFPKGGEADKMIADLATAKTFNVAMNKVSLASPDEEKQIVNDWAPKGAGFAAQEKNQAIFEKAIDQKHAAIDKDASGYVLQNSPELRNQFNQAFQMQNDPKAKPEDIQAAFKQAGASLDAAYDHLGVPSYNRPFLPADQAQRMVKEIVTAPADQRTEIIDKLASQTGDMWPRVMGDLVKSKLPPEYEVLAAVPNPTSRIALSNAIGDGKKTVRDSLAQGDAKTIDEAIESDSKMQELRQSFGDVSAGAEKFDHIQNAVKLMAYQFASSGNPERAADRAISALTDERYDFWQQGNSTARVPQGTLPEIKSAASTALGNLKATDLAVPANPSGTQLTNEQLQNVSLSAVKRGRWVTNENESGLVRLDINGVPVMLANGQRMELMFADALKPASTSETETPPADMGQQ